MAQLRVADPGRRSFSVQQYVSDESAKAELAEKVARFYEMPQQYRRRIPYTPIHRLLQEILDESGYRNYVTALPAGEQRRANLDMLMEKAVATNRPAIMDCSILSATLTG